MFKTEICNRCNQEIKPLYNGIYYYNKIYHCGCVIEVMKEETKKEFQVNRNIKCQLS